MRITDPHKSSAGGRRRWNRFVLGAFCAVMVLSGVRYTINRTPFADRLVGSLLLGDTDGNADAIVVLGGGILRGCEPNNYSVRRVMLAWRLWRQGRAPVVVFTGGTPRGFACPIADSMMNLAEELGVPRERMRFERTSSTTFENAQNAIPVLRALAARRILVVTDRLHMTRAAGAFARFGFQIERASVPVYLGHEDNISMLWHGARETAALAYYRTQGWTAPIAAVPYHQPRQQSTEGIVSSMKLSNPAGPIVILGASYAGGWKTSRVAGIPVVNKGVSGQQSFELLGRFEQDVLPSAPRAVVIWGHINDMFRTPRPDVRSAVARAEDSYAKMIQLARQHGIEPILATEVTIPAGTGFAEKLASLAGALRGREGYQDWINRHVLEVNNWMRAFALREGVLLLDLQPELSDPNGRRATAFATEDGTHISAAGYDRIDRYALPMLDHHFGGN